MIPAENWHEFDSERGERWRVDLGAVGSGWACGWGTTCHSIGATPDPTHTLGCCILGAQFVDEDDAMNVAAHAAFLDSERFEFHAVAESDGIFTDDGRGTRVVDGACIFLNRATFAGGAGCALHLGALDDEELPHEWKPLVCWQVPFQLERRVEAGVEVSVLRRKHRVDFNPPGDHSDPIPWLCTEDEAFYVTEGAVIDRLADEFDDWLGQDVADELRRRLAEG